MCEVAAAKTKTMTNLSDEDAASAATELAFVEVTKQAAKSEDKINGGPLIASSDATSGPQTVLFVLLPDPWAGARLWHLTLILIMDGVLVPPRTPILLRTSDHEHIRLRLT